MRHTDGMGGAQRSYIRRIVREEIVRALEMLQRAADHLDTPYETAELDSRALGNIAQAAENTVRRMTCEHGASYSFNGTDICSRCGEPVPAPADPFEERL